MADAEFSPSYTEDDQAGRPEPRRGVDVVTMIAGIATLLVSTYLLSDGATWFPQFDLRWVLAGGAVLVGVLMLGASLRGGKK